jgi:hypothetical protein
VSNVPSWSRADPMSLIPAAAAMYEAGRTRREVLEAIYGVDFPSETVPILRDFVSGDKPLAVSWRIQPWELMVRPEDRDPDMDLGPLQCDEEARVYAEAPNVVLLARFGYDGVELGSSLIGYDLDELRAGRSTVVGLKSVPRLPLKPFRFTFTVFGPSVLDVLHEVVASYLDDIRRRAKHDPHEDPEPIERQLARVVAVQRELAGEPVG